MTQHTRIFNSFELYAEDIECEFCEHTMRKSKKFQNVCREETCRYETDYSFIQQEVSGSIPVFSTT